MNDLPRRALAELVGTFAFFTIGAGAVVISGIAPNQIALVGIALAHGVALAVMVSIFMGISGGQFNPAVSIGLWIGGKMRSAETAVYVAAQLVGGTLAGIVLSRFFTEAQWTRTHLGTPALAAGVPVGRAILVEAVLTFFLLLAVWGTAVDPRAPAIGGFGIGLMVFADILVGGPLTGAAMNPARVFGPALAATLMGDGGGFDNHFVYWVGPLAGGAIASILYRTFFYPEVVAPGEVEVADEPVPPIVPPLTDV